MLLLELREPTQCVLSLASVLLACSLAVAAVVVFSHRSHQIPPHSSGQKPDKVCGYMPVLPTQRNRKPYRAPFKLPWNWQPFWCTASHCAPKWPLWRLPSYCYAMTSYANTLLHLTRLFPQERGCLHETIMSVEVQVGVQGCKRRTPSTKSRQFVLLGVPPKTSSCQMLQ